VADANFSTVFLLLHADGANGSTTITDSSGSPRTCTAVNGAQLATAQSKFGASSILFDGTDDCVNANGSTTNLAGDYTFEGWARLTSTSPQALLALPLSNWIIYINGTGKLTLFGASTDVITGGTTITANSWFHWAWVRSSGSVKIYLNGTSQGAFSNSSTLNAAEIVLGDIQSTGGGLPAGGYLDEVRCSSMARYTANFTAPTAAFEDGSVPTATGFTSTAFGTATARQAALCPATGAKTTTFGTAQTTGPTVVVASGARTTVLGQPMAMAFAATGWRATAFGTPQTTATRGWQVTRFGAATAKFWASGSTTTQFGPAFVIHGGAPPNQLCSAGGWGTAKHGTATMVGVVRRGATGANATHLGAPVGRYGFHPPGFAAPAVPSPTLRIGLHPAGMRPTAFGATSARVRATATPADAGVTFGTASATRARTYLATAVYPLARFAQPTGRSGVNRVATGVLTPHIGQPTLRLKYRVAQVAPVTKFGAGQLARVTSC
jgi:hypothetical protein